jgi:hypothetical protein
MTGDLLSADGADANPQTDSAEETQLSAASTEGEADALDDRSALDNGLASGGSIVLAAATETTSALVSEPGSTAYSDYGVALTSDDAEGADSTAAVPTGTGGSVASSLVRADDGQADGGPSDDDADSGLATAVTAATTQIASATSTIDGLL